MRSNRALLTFVSLWLMIAHACSTAKQNVHDDHTISINTSNIFHSMSVPHSTYIVHGRINLGGKHLIVPQGSTIFFNKGSISNGEITFQDTRLEGAISIDCLVNGVVRNDTLYTDWFIKGAKTLRKISDVSQRMQSIIDLGPEYVIFGKGLYQFAGVHLGKNVHIDGQGTIIRPALLKQTEYSFSFLKNVFYAKDAESVFIKNITFQGTITGTILSGFKSDKIYGEPLIWVDKADKVVIDGCVFRDIENCTYCNKAYTYYGRKQGSCVCLWDVSDASYINCEQVNCRHDEQVWIIAVNKPIMDTKVTYTGNYIHDMTPGPNSSAFTCVAGTCLMENNKVEGYRYPGSMFNVFAKKAIIRNNEIKDSYCSSVFDVCEYRYFHNDDVVIESNSIDAVNSVLVLGQSEKVTIRNNRFRGLGLYYSANNRRPQKETGGYQYWYSDANEVLPTDAETLIDGNICDLTAYDGTRSIAGASADYATGEITGTQSYNNVGVNYGCGILLHPNEAKAGSITITNNSFTSISSLDGVVDKNNLANLYPYTIKLVNTQNATIKGNTFNGGYSLFNSPSEYTCIGIYNYPDVMEQLEKPGVISRAPSHYGKYVIEDNVFNVPEGKTFYPCAVYARVNSSRRTTLNFKELVVRNNSNPGPRTKTTRNISQLEEVTYKQVGPVKAFKEVLK